MQELNIFIEYYHLKRMQRRKWQLQKVGPSRVKTGLVALGIVVPNSLWQEKKRVHI